MEFLSKYFMDWVPACGDSSIPPELKIQHKKLCAIKKAQARRVRGFAYD